MQDTDLSIQTAKAFKAIIRFMQARGLKQGDHLPPQQELRRILGFSNDTLTGAMNRLVTEGVLTRRRRVGTIVVKPDGPEQITWSVGVATRGVRAGDPNAFRAEVAHRLVSYLLQAGCSCRLYHLPLPAPDGRGAVGCTLDQFYGLAGDVSAGRLDAVIFNAYVIPAIFDEIGRSDVEAIRVSRMGPAPKGVVVDEADAVTQGIEHLIEGGAKRIALVGNEALPDWHPSVAQVLDQAPTRYAAMLAHLAYHQVPAGVTYGQSFATQLLALPRDARPDGLIMGDDFTATGLAETLRAQADYRPAIVVMTARQLPLFFPIPVAKLEFDIDQLASMGVQQLLRRLRNPALPTTIEWVRRTLVPVSHHPWTTTPQPAPAAAAVAAP